ncbi:DeoR/GlpR family DNA-binding transcription regulator [Peribacillus sp. NPDC101481]|jgi:DeoR/GlpR family transcriptional regulator of sugar metabolism|uniref:DeoR/GlpR family DNA-binding transcription regulator n=1 Tax=Peribacillus frigoritolerans TaxID=450367 RepID=A0AAJ1VE30_9BACI|nr:MULTISPECIES: DeoR/GlpR family DNA-binding transcription regulator [Bacillaceae]MBT2615848.1 DeoR/GlpR transcriptional regulator [Bacillus sp. ISL-78]MBT2630400.1 DeoR/GlpR transcriptional regulator [Bacillus sp. ISL-101]MBT2714435.1 DeoR/GlpR transcriptional regulator [Bacillus sp. ISL-57]MDM5284023.1 DeoR/GlpR family DNA-binding transcription regulator [Peribacillus frigoritolerans]MDR4926839.1 DeoR/GlpR family DNA-binding transcription regulator [Peribacillus simplex]
MLVAQRHQKIVELVNERSSIRVTELSEIFSVTEETIRRDLEKLEKETKLKRSHGGAVSLQEDDSEIHFSERVITNVNEKKVIAYEAAKRIVEGDRIILDASTTAWYMSKALPNIPLTVITNSTKVVMELSKKEKIEVISTGGRLLSKSLSFVGPIAEKSLTMYHVNKTFLSCKGIHLEEGLSDSNEGQALLKKKMIERSDAVILMVDSSKFGKKAFSLIVPPSEVDEVITDREIDEASRKLLEKRNVKVTIVK